jgi:FHA domain
MMGNGTVDSPRLVVIGPGQDEGRVLPLQRGIQSIGRGDKATIRIAHPEVSREHAFLQWDGRTATIADNGSTNGTSVNGRPVSGRQVLNSDDIVSLGYLELRYDGGRSGDSGPGRGYAGDTEQMSALRLDNRVGRDNYGHIVQAGRDVSYDEWHVENRLQVDDPWDEMFTGAGVGRALMVLGLIVALAGFGGWAALIFSGISGNDPSFDPFARHFLGLPVAPIAFGAFLLGGVIAGVGRGMSRAARSRQEHRSSGRERTRRYA